MSKIMSYTVTETESETQITGKGLSLGRFKKRDLVRSAVAINNVVLSKIFASKTERSQGAPSVTRDVLYSSLRAALGGGFNILHGGQLQPSTSTMYSLMCKKHNKNPNSVNLGDGAKGHWIGDPNSKWVMLFAPGGAFIMPGTFAHFDLLFHMRQRAKKRFHDFAILVMDYSLVPDFVYPTQLRQMASALRYLVNGQMRDPDNILLGGDSAGGNLVAALLLHLSNPHPSVEPIKLRKKIHAAVMLSPWISFSIDTPAFTLNAKKDMLTAPAIALAGRAYVATTPPGDIYAEPVLATPAMWSEVANSVVSDVLVTAGGNELLCDEIVIFMSRLQDGFNAADKQEGGGFDRQVGKSRVELEVCPGEGHDEVVIDYISLLTKGKGKSASVLKSWMAEIM